MKGSFHWDLGEAIQQRKREDLVRRREAAMSACEGIPTEELERGIIHDMKVVAHLVNCYVPVAADHLMFAGDKNTETCLRNLLKEAQSVLGKIKP